MVTTEEFWKEQLKHAHSRNALVDNHRFALLQMLPAFHGLLLTALIIKRNERILLSPHLGWLPLVLASGVLAVGLTLFGTFLSEHVYMRTYKRWIGALEANLLIALKLPSVGAAEVNHSGSLYWDDNTPFVPFERTLVFTLGLFVILNLGLPALVALSLGAKVLHVGGLVIVGAFFHLLCLWFILRHPAQQPSQAIARSQGSSGHYADNAIDAAEHHRGWFLGHFITDGHSLLRTPGLELKWGIHSKDDERPSWDKGTSRFSISVLVRGDFVIAFKDAEYRLQREGDFVIWGPEVPHTWRALDDSVIVTVRWPQRKLR